MNQLSPSLLSIMIIVIITITSNDYYCRRSSLKQSKQRDCRMCIYIYIYIYIYIVLIITVVAPLSNKVPSGKMGSDGCLVGIYMYIYICMCMYVCMYVCIYIYIHLFTYLHVYNIYIYIYVLSHVAFPLNSDVLPDKQPLARSCPSY